MRRGTRRNTSKQNVAARPPPALARRASLGRRRLRASAPSPAPIPKPIKMTHEELCELLASAPPNASLLLAADPGVFSGVPKVRFLLENAKVEADKVGRSASCPSVAVGTLLGQPAIMGTTGIGPPAASACTAELLSCGAAIDMREVVWLGTSGWSPQPGGVLNADDCSEANPSTDVTRVGDICVSPFGEGWCFKASWTEQARWASRRASGPPAGGAACSSSWAAGNRVAGRAGRTGQLYQGRGGARRGRLCSELRMAAVEPRLLALKPSHSTPLPPCPRGLSRSGFPNQCFQPPVDPGPEADFLFGYCMFANASDASLALADELVAAAKAASYSARPASLRTRSCTGARCRTARGWRTGTTPRRRPRCATTRSALRWRRRASGAVRGWWQEGGRAGAGAGAGKVAAQPRRVQARRDNGGARQAHPPTLRARSSAKPLVP